MGEGQCLPNGGRNSEQANFEKLLKLALACSRKCALYCSLMFSYCCCNNIIAVYCWQAQGQAVSRKIDNVLSYFPYCIAYHTCTLPQYHVTTSIVAIGKGCLKTYEKNLVLHPSKKKNTCEAKKFSSKREKISDIYVV